MSAHTRLIRALRCDDRVFIQNQGGRHRRKLDKVNTVVKPLHFNQYNVKVEGFGRITRRNRRFIPMTVIPETVIPMTVLPQATEIVPNES